LRLAQKEVESSGLMKKGSRKNPHADALGKLGGLVRSEAKRQANRENGRKGARSKAARRPWRRDAMRADPVLGVRRALYVLRRTRLRVGA
jgi:hypothetical protein